MLLAFVLTVRERASSLLVWSAILAVLLYDDALEVHENLARAIAPTIRDVPGIRDVSALSEAPWLPELVVLSTMGVICLGAALLARVFARPTVRGVHTALIVILGVGALFGVGADTIQSPLERGTTAWLVASLVEQAGEAMTTVAVVVALIVWIGNGIDPTRPEVRSGTDRHVEEDRELR